MIAVLVLFVLSLSGRQTIGIMSAMDIELEMIKENMTVEQIDTIAQRIFYKGTFKRIPCVCVMAGIGKVNAALTAEILIMKYDIEAIIFTGVAGGINPELGIGDIVISQSVVHHDYAHLGPEKLTPYDTLGYKADSSLVAIAIQAAKDVRFDEIPIKICKETGHFPRVVLGKIITGDQFIASEEKRQWLELTFNADCVEMEGAAVAQVCAINAVPFVIIRCLSDLANEKADIDFEAFVEYAAKNSNLIVQGIIDLLDK
jgi:adenosylhomocysteine nucleosidase